MTDEIEFIKTPDIDLASVLYCLGFGIDGIYSSGRGSQMDFYFKANEQLRKAMDDYYQRKLRMEPTELLTARQGIINKVKNEASTVQPKAN